MKIFEINNKQLEGFAFKFNNRRKIAIQLHKATSTTCMLKLLTCVKYAWETYMKFCIF